MSGLPQCASLIVEEAKIIRYVPSRDHIDGGSKARFFLARGFSAEAWHEFADALKRHGATQTITNEAVDATVGSLSSGACSKPLTGLIPASWRRFALPMHRSDREGSGGTRQQHDHPDRPIIQQTRKISFPFEELGKEFL